MKTITYVEFGSDGHRPVWIRSVINAFKKGEPECKLSIWVPKDFIEKHKWCSPYLSSGSVSTGNITFRFYEEIISEDKANKLSRFEVIRKCAETDNADVCFLANNLDACVKDIAFSRPGALKTKLVGVLDQPFLHYAKFASRVTKEWLSPYRYLSAYIKTFLMCHHSFVAEVLMLDPLAPSFYNRVFATSKFRFLPEYVTEVDLIPDFANYFGLPANRKIILLAGCISRYKGVIEFLNALKEALRYPDFREHVCIIIAGEVVSDVRNNVYDMLSAIRLLQPSMPIFLFDRLLTDEEFVSLISLSDVICLPYGTVPTTSGLLMHATAYGRPVVAYDFGIVGELIRNHRLGVLYDQPGPQEIAKALCKSIEGFESLDSGNVRALKTFAARYSVSLEKFGEEICTSLIRVASKS